MNVKPIPIEDMDLSVRSYNCLKRAKIDTLQDLSKLTDDDLMRVRNLGVRCVTEIIEKCKLYGVDIRENAHESETVK